ncbi:MAG: amidohydrolase family protein [Reichenbachiella sp.]|uniref:amidohydrolase family protein n=1 Tax=Reichenbachiella sp. TaxID=2184521 RepID=UPI0032662C51
MKTYLLLLLLLPLQLLGQTTIIKDVNVLDVERRRIIKNTSIVISDGVIDKIEKFKKIKISEKDNVIDGKGRFMIPGLIDAHIHFFQSGGLYTRPDALDLREIVSYEEEVEFANTNVRDYLKRYLRNGITTVIDVGGPMWNFQVRDSIAQSITGPNVLVTGPLFSMVDRPKLDIGDPPIIEVSTKQEVLNLFNKQLPYRPDFIKVWYVVTQENPAEKTFPLVEYLAKLCKENNLKLAVHATELQTAQLAVKAGADILVHSIDDEIIPESFIKELKDEEITYIPTLTVMDGYIKAFTGEIQHTKEDLTWANPLAYNTLLDPNKIAKTLWPPQLKSMYGKDRPAIFNQMDSIMLVNLANLSEVEVTIATGTDAGNIGTMHASSYFKELLAMKKAGLSNWELLLYSTLNPAKGFGISDKIGSIKTGKRADVILLDKNPIEDIENLNAISLIIKSGKPLKPESILIETLEQVVQRQVNAYNARNIDAFIDAYSDDIKIYNETGELIMEGLDQMRKQYAGMFESVTNLYCEIENRIVINNKVIDKEKVRFNESFVDAVAVYEVSNGKIKQVNFIK